MGNPIRILLVDDQREQRARMRDLLDTDERFEVTSEASDGNEALRQAVEDRPDVVVVDLMLPGMNGLRVVSALRREVPDAKVVVVSALVGPDRIFEEARRRGASACIQKPLLFRQLQSTLLELAQ